VISGLTKREKRIAREFEKREVKILSEYATFSKDADRRYEEKYPNIRPAFSRDADRILHSFAFTRYIDKTQVFYLSENDFISHRVIHVQLVSKIGRIVARALGLNEDLVEAIALGHDIGHTPFGHEGEEILSNEVTQKMQESTFYFHHSVQSVRFLDELEGYRFEKTWKRTHNLTLQVLDGILCHDGEELKKSICPNRNKTWDDFDKEVEKKRGARRVEIVPMTLEGCLVRFVDVIAYLGRDIEDAVAIGLLDREDFPKVIGESNREIVNNLAMDIIKNSFDKDAICYSQDIYEGMKELWSFNYDNIYKNPLIKAQKDKVADLIIFLYKRILSHVKDKKEDSPVFIDHINFIDRDDPNNTYFRNTPPEVIAIDYISGMTDDYFINVFNELFFPKKLPFNFRQIERVTGLPKNRLFEMIEREKSRVDE